METENKPLLSIKNLKTIFDLDEGSVKAVDGVSFDIFPQRVLGIVGESGCGCLLYTSPSPRDRG